LEFHFIWKWYLWCLICRWRFINSYKLYVIFNDIHIFFFLKENPGQVHRGVANGWSKSQVLLLVLRLLIRKNLPTTRPIDVPNPKPTLEYCPTKNTVLWWRATIVAWLWLSLKLEHMWECLVVRIQKQCYWWSQSLPWCVKQNNLRHKFRVL
jgi:hypothetical protein